MHKAVWQGGHGRRRRGDQHTECVIGLTLPLILMTAHLFLEANRSKLTAGWRSLVLRVGKIARFHGKWKEFRLVPPNGQ